MRSSVRVGATVAAAMLLAACRAGSVSVDQAGTTGPDDGEHSALASDRPPFWTARGDEPCSTHMALDVELSELTETEAAELDGSPGFATSLDGLVRQVLAPGTALGRPHLQPEYVEDFDSALPPDGDDRTAAPHSDPDTRGWGAP